MVSQRTGEKNPPSRAAAGAEVRLELKKPSGAARGSVDGGWWPRSLEPEAEFPALVTALEERMDRVSRVVYNLDLWESAPRTLEAGGRVFRCGGFHSMDTHTVTAIGADSSRLDLLVVPPDTPGGAARAVLRSAADHDSTATVDDILASNGVR
jgi:hypothetical protein